MEIIWSAALATAARHLAREAESHVGLRLQANRMATKSVGEPVSQEQAELVRSLVLGFPFPATPAQRNFEQAWRIACARALGGLSVKRGGRA
jgi:hypothetical protein